MYKFTVFGLLYFVCIISITYGSTEGQDFNIGLQIFGKSIRHYLNSHIEDFKIGEGVHIINTKSPNDARSNTDDGSVIGAMENYLRNHEIRIRLPELMPENGIGRSFKDIMEGFDNNENGKY